MADNEEDAEEGDEARVLGQDEIDALLGNDSEMDTLLGFDTGSDEEEDVVEGIFAILNKSTTAYEKLPMMEVVFDRLVRQLSTALRNFTSENIDVSLDSMTSVRFDDYINSIPLPALMVVFRAVEWENYGIINVQSQLIYAMVDMLLGGRKASGSSNMEGRAYTTIEQDIIKRMIDVILSELSSAFEPLSPATFHYERLETNPRFATITRPANPALLIRLQIDMVEGRGGIVEIMLPHTTLEPVRDLLLQMFMGENFGQDTVWEKHLGRELRNTAVTVEAVFDEKTVTLKDIMGLKVGNTILLDCEPEDDMQLRVGGVPVTSAVMGKVGQNIAVSLNDPIRRKSKDDG